jgi:hypothetical protein
VRTCNNALTSLTFPSFCISSFLFQCSMHVIGIMACSRAFLVAKTIAACMHACLSVSIRCAMLLMMRVACLQTHIASFYRNSV